MNAIGQPISRIDGRLKVTGGARYTADIPVEGIVHGVIVQSTIANGRTTSIDTSRGRARSRRVGSVYASQHAAHEPDPKALEPFASTRAIVSSSSGRQDSLRRPADRVWLWPRRAIRQHMPAH